MCAQPRHDISDVAAALADKTEQLVREILPDAVRQGNQLVAGDLSGSAGASLKIDLSGRYRGHWCEWESDQRGDALDLIAAVKFNGDLGKARSWALDWLGGNFSERPATAKQEPLKKQEPSSSKTWHRALVIWRETVPAAGTFSDLYLQARGIQFAIPPNIRHHHSLRHESGTHWPALICRMDDEHGKFSGIHRIYLDPHSDPERVLKAPVAKPKMSLGPNGTAWFGHRDADVIVIGEGIEKVLVTAEHLPNPLPPWLGEPDTEPHKVTPVCAFGTSGLATFTPPPTVRRMFVCEDVNEGGKKAARACKLRARTLGIKATVLRKGTGACPETNTRQER